MDDDWITEYGVVTPDDNDIINFGPDREPAEEEVRNFYEEGLDHPHVVSRRVTAWQRLS